MARGDAPVPLVGDFCVFVSREDPFRNPQCCTIARVRFFASSCSTGQFFVFRFPAALEQCRGRVGSLWRCGMARAGHYETARVRRRGAGCVPAPWNGVDAAPWGGAGSWYGLEQGAVEAVFRFRCQNGRIAKSFQNFIGKTHLKKIFLDSAGTAKYFIKLCLFAKQPVATKEEMTRGSV